MDQSASMRAETMYQSRHRKNQTMSADSPEAEQLVTGTTDDFSRNRESIRRISYVFDRILEIVPEEHRDDNRYIMMKTMLKEGLKDLALVPDRIMLPLFAELSQALVFVADGSMEELEAYLASQRDNAEEG